MTILTIAAIWLLASIPLGLAIARCIPPTLDDSTDQRFRMRKACGSWRSVGQVRCAGEIIQHGKGF